MHQQSEAKIGRPRRYDLRAPESFAHPEVGMAAAALDELRARVIDQIEDLDDAALRAVPEGTTLSIAALVVHMVWAEQNWIARITGYPRPADMRTRLDPAGRAVPAGERVVPEMSAADLVALCRRVRDEVTLPALTAFTALDEALPSDDHPMTPRGVLMHLIWHWTYHAGQIGLLRELAGHGYTWTFGALGRTKSRD
jgi:uncharacterized damage-inducible protein DinB